MLKGLGLFFAITVIFLSQAALIHEKTRILQYTSSHSQDNHAPVVRIMRPLNNSIYESATRIPYSIQVSDQEDGESAYQEIPSREVLLKVKYLPEIYKLNSYLKQKDNRDSSDLQQMMISNCFNCHAIKTHLIGPSFQEINKHYPHTRSKIDSLEKRIALGVTGIWGREVMPTHPELTGKQIKQMVNWIMRNANDNDPTVDYYAGMEGSFQYKEQKSGMNKGILVLAASYTDHGPKNHPGQKLKGKDLVIVHLK